MKAQRPYLYDAVYRWVTDNFWTPYLLVDAKVKGAIVPVNFVKDGKIVLNVSVDAVNHFTQDENGISFSARFSGKSENLVIPYAAMIALYAKENAQGLVFPYEEVLASEVENSVKNSPDESKEKQNGSKASLKLIK